MMGSKVDRISRCGGKHEHGLQRLQQLSTKETIRMIPKLCIVEGDVEGLICAGFCRLWRGLLRILRIH
jgi:hypothetical protein